MEREQKRPSIYTVSSWEEAQKLVRSLAQDGSIALGAGNSYPEDYTIHYLDALSGEGMGYRLWRNEDGRHVELMATIYIGLSQSPQNAREKP